MINVVLLNGGRGASSIIPALLDRDGVNLTSIVNAYDDGLSTGQIRKFFQMLGPSDIRKVQELMLPCDEYYTDHKKLFSYRFPSPYSHQDAIRELRLFGTTSHLTCANLSLHNDRVAKHIRVYINTFLDALSLIQHLNGELFDFSDASLMNCIYAGAYIFYKRDLELATKSIDQLFSLRGLVLPTSSDNLHLAAIRENGQVLFSEAEIVQLRSNVRIKRLFLLQKPIDPLPFSSLTPPEQLKYLDMHHSFVHISPGVEHALNQADIIIYTAGTQHSSLYPTYMTHGVAKTISENRTCYKAFDTNVGADYETPRYKASDYISGALSYLNPSGHFVAGSLVTEAFINDPGESPSPSHVLIDHDMLASLKIPCNIMNLESDSSSGKHNGPALVNEILARYRVFSSPL